MTSLHPPTPDQGITKAFGLTVFAGHARYPFSLLGTSKGLRRRFASTLQTAEEHAESIGPCSFSHIPSSKNSLAYI